MTCRTRQSISLKMQQRYVCLLALRKHDILRLAQIVGVNLPSFEQYVERVVPQFDSLYAALVGLKKDTE